jgi:hypothetical protein
LAANIAKLPELVRTCCAASPAVVCQAIFASRVGQWLNCNGADYSVGRISFALARTQFPISVCCLRGEGIEGDNLTDEIRVCVRHAEECARKAEEARGPTSRESFLEMQRRWLRLAHRYQFAKELKGFRKAISDTQKPD